MVDTVEREMESWNFPSWWLALTTFCIMFSEGFKKENKQLLYSGCVLSTRVEEDMKKWLKISQCLPW